jgi:GT2 family glycosyltransferase
MSEYGAKVSIVIPNLHSPVIGQVLEALRTQDYDLDQVEVLVMGLDRHKLVREDDLVQFVSTGEPVPPARARNLGAAAVQGEKLIFLDADCVPQPGWLAAMLDAAARWSDAGAISGAMLPEGDTFALHCGQVAGFHEHLNLNPPGQRRVLASFSLLVPRSVWLAVGGFDEQFKFAAGEDLDLSIRIALCGHPLYFEPRAAVRHRPRRAGWQSLWQHAYRGGTQAIVVRQRYAGYYQMPRWMLTPWVWVLLSPVIALARTVQIYFGTPRLWRYWRCGLWVALSKLAWCWGAAAGLVRPSTISPTEKVV